MTILASGGQTLDWRTTPYAIFRPRIFPALRLMWVASDAGALVMFMAHGIYGQGWPEEKSHHFLAAGRWRTTGAGWENNARKRERGRPHDAGNYVAGDGVRCR